MRNDIILVGAGGHAKVCIDILSDMGEKIAYCIGSGNDPDYCFGIPVLKDNNSFEILKSRGYSRIFIAIGDNQTRAKLANLVLKEGFHFVNAISPSAIISSSAILGKGIVVMPGVIINVDTKIGDLSIINTGSVIDHDCVIGYATHIAPHCGLAGNVFIEDFTFLGIGAKVIPKITVGNNCIVGAGSVVIKNIPAFSKAVGVPAQILKG
jgi:UDP-perosamine 4-acetyltransferase